jgi:TonB family protein
MARISTPRRTVKINLGRLSIFSAVAAVAANGALFYVLALVRAEAPSRADSEYEMIKTIAVDLAEPSKPEEEIAEAQTDVFQAASDEIRAVAIEPVADVTPSLLPRLSDWIGDMSPDAAGLPVVLPSLSDLKPTDSAGASGLGEHLSILKVDRMPSKVSGGVPRYPEWARRGGLEAVVTLRFVVTTEGQVQDVKVHEIEGDERFGEEAVKAVATWRFEPAIKGGKAVGCWCFQKVNFKLVH